MKKIKDHLLTGILLGLAGPLILAFLFYISKFGNASLSTFLEAAAKEKLLSPLLSLCALVNLGSFYLFLNAEKYYIARGIILSTFIYGFVIVVLKFLV